MAAVRGSRLILCVGLLSCLCAPVWGQFRVPSRIPSRDVLDRFDLVLDWWGTSVIDAPRDKILLLTLGEQNLYVQSVGGTISTFNTMTGRRLWTTQVTQSDNSTARPVEWRDWVLVTSGLGIYGLRKQDGQIRFKLPLDHAPTATPAVDRNSLYMVNRQGTLLSYNLNRVLELDEENRLEKGSGLALRWRYFTSRETRMPPVVQGGYVYFAAADGSFYSLTTLSHQLNFRFESQYPLSAPPTAVDGGFLLTTENFHLYCVDGKSGRMRWDFVSGPRITQAARSVENQVFVSPELSPMLCLDAKRGVKLWQSQSPASFVAASPKRVYASDHLGNLLCLSRETGQTISTIPMPQFTLRMANDVTDRIIMSTPSGTVVSLRDRDLPQTLQYRFPERQPINPDFAPETPVSKDGEAATTPAEGTPAEKTEAKDDGEVKKAGKKPAADETEKKGDDEKAEEKKPEEK